MSATRESRTLSTRIACPADAVYDFLCRPETMRQWASGLGQSLRRAGKVWIVDTPEGPATVRFTERNPFGVADHWVKPAGGAEIYIPIRVVANGDGAEVLFTLFRQPGMSTAQFDADAEWVERDLAALQAVLEGRDQASASAFSRS